MLGFLLSGVRQCPGTALAIRGQQGATLGATGTRGTELPPMALTDVAIRKASPTGKVQRLTDGGGLYLEIAPAGGKWWRYKYRYGGKEKRLSLGTYPDTGLADARAKHATARKLLAAGIDPGEQRKAEKLATQERSANTFAAVAAELLAQRAKKLAAGFGGTGAAAAGNRLGPAHRQRPDCGRDRAHAAAGATQGGTSRSRRNCAPRADAGIAGIPLCHRHGTRRPQPCRRPVGRVVATGEQHTSPA